MHIYSKTSALFLKRAKHILKKILSEEVGLKVHKTRFELKQQEKIYLMEFKEIEARKIEFIKRNKSTVEALSIN